MDERRRIRVRVRIGPSRRTSARRAALRHQLKVVLITVVLAIWAIWYATEPSPTRSTPGLHNDHFAGFLYRSSLGERTVLVGMDQD